MKFKIFVIMFCMVLLLGSVSALTLNSGNFDSRIGDYGGYQIKGLLGSSIKDITLTENTEACYYDRCYAIMDVTLHKKGTLVDDLSFYKEVKGNWIPTDIRSYSFYYRLKGTSKWIPYVLKTELAMGIYEVKLIGSKKLTWKVDWVIKSSGIWTDDWAIWDATEIRDPTNMTVTNTGNLAFWNGILIKPTAVLDKVKVEKNSSCDSPGARITWENGTIIDTAPFVGDWATFNTTTVLQNNTLYRIEVDPSGGVDVWNTSYIYPAIGINIEFLNGSQSGNSNDTSDLYNILAINYTAPQGVVVLVSPTNNDVLNTNEVLFNSTASVIGGATLVNMSLYTNESGAWLVRNSTIGLTGTSNQSDWNRTYASGETILWNVRTCDSDGDCGFSVSNFTFFVDTDAPTIVISSPNETFDYLSTNTSLWLNVTNTDPSLDKCWYNYNGTNFTYACSTGVQQNSTFLQELDNFNITLYANDSSGNLANNISTWNFKIFETNRTFQNETLEGSSESFTLEYEVNPSFQTSLVSLFYNNTFYPSTFSLSGVDVTTNNMVTAPNVGASNNITFLWSVTLSNGDNINTTTSRQLVSSLDIDNCSTHTTLIYNYTLLDEEDRFKLQNTSIEISLDLYNSERTFQVLTFSQLYNDTNPAQICLSTNLLNTTNYSVDSTVKYSSNHTGTPYALEYYNILNFTLNNQTASPNIDLFDLILADSTEFQLTFRNSDLALQGNTLINVYRQYVSENLFRIVEIPITDSNGQTILHLVKDDIVYNLIMVDSEGNILATFNNIIAFCQDFTIGACALNLNPPALESTAYNHLEDVGITYTISYSNVTELISMDFTVTDLTSRTVRIKTTRDTAFGNRTVCDESLTSSSGIISCNVSSAVDTDNFLFIEIFVDGDYKATETISLGEVGGNMGAIGFFIAFFLILTMIIIFMEDKQVLVISLGLGWIAVISLGLISGSLFGSISAGIWLLVTIFIFLWKLRKEEVR